MSNKSERVLLAILDGWGVGSRPEADAIKKAKTPFVDSLYKNHPHAELVTFGEEVGLPEGQMGNSEVGHLNIGAGRIVYQELLRINNSVKDGDFFENPVLLSAFAEAKKRNRPVHLMGLVSDGGVHSHINHLKALCDLAEKSNAPRTFIHAFMDGRDTSPTGGIDYLKEIEQHIADKPGISIASIIGRYYAMDRDKRWERIKLAYDLLVSGKGMVAENALDAISTSYENDITDEFIDPISIRQQDGRDGKIQSGDVVIFFNFRTDRPRQITHVLTQGAIEDQDMSPLDIHYTTMTRYDETFEGLHVVFDKDNIKNTLGEVLAQNGKTQTRIAETEKYPHVTFFFSGGKEQPFEGEDRILVNSPKVATYDLQPEMSAPEVTDKILEAIADQPTDFICLNYANADMVGHTGVFEAAVKAVETVDECLGRLVNAASQKGYTSIIIADHGNSDCMINEDGSPHTAHTTNPVPCFLVSPKGVVRSIKSGKLADIAPTVLELLGITPPSEMDGESLLDIITN